MAWRSDDCRGINHQWNGQIVLIDRIGTVFLRLEVGEYEVQGKAE